MKKILSIIVVLISSVAFSQEKIVTGTITDEYNELFLGVNVLIGGTNQGTVADIDGHYSIKVNEGDVLVFSYLGYLDIKKPVAGQTLIDVVMNPDVEALDVVEITGIRASQTHAVLAKRNAATVIEAITPEDIGSFSDTNVADALQRVAGVQIERDVDGVSGDRVSIRGIGPQFVKVTVNGRSPLSAGNEGKSDFRQFNLGVIPTEIISGAKIHKTTQAKEVSTSIGGTVDFQTLRPLDQKYKGGKEYFASASLRGSSVSQFEDIDFSGRVSAIVGGKVSDKLGVSLAVIYADEDGRKDETSLRGLQESTFNVNSNGNTVFDDGDTTYNNIVAARTINNVIQRNNRQRLGISTGVQWKPNDALDVIFDYTRTSVQSNSDRQILALGINRDLLEGDHLFSPGDVTVDDNFFQTLSASSNESASSTISIRNQFFDNRATNNIVGLRTEYDATEKLKLLFDVSYSNLDFFQNLTQITGKLAADDFDQTDLGIDISGERPSFELPNEINDPSLITLDNLTRRLIRTQGYNYSANIDAEYEINKKAKLSLGARYAKTDFEARQSENLSIKDVGDGITDDQRLNFKSVLGDFTGLGFNGGNAGDASNGWLSVPGNTVLDFYPGYNDLSGGSIFDFDVDLEDVQSQEGDIAFDPARSYGAAETSTDFYTQLDLKTEMFELPVALNFGVRVVRTGNKSAGFSASEFEDVDGNENTARSEEAIYHEVETSRWDVIPSFNANFTVTKDTKLRLSVARGVSRPRYRDLIPNNTVTFVDDPSAVDFSDVGTRGQITSGNPELKPYSAWLFDSTLEFYTNNGGAFILSSFYKRLHDYIGRTTLQNQEYPGFELLGVELPEDQEGLLFDITRVENISDGTIYGFEAGFSQHLSFFPGFFKGLGVKANYSFVESSFDEFTTGDSANGFPGSSRHNANGTLYFERYGITFRFTAAYRSDYLSNLGGLGNTRADEGHYTEGTTVYGLTLKRNFLDKHLQISAGVTNLTGEDVRRYQGDDKDNLSAYFDRDPVWKLSLRYKL